MNYVIEEMVKIIKQRLKLNKKTKKYYEKHKEKILEKANIKRTSLKEEYNLKQKQYYYNHHEQNKEKNKMRMRKWREKTSISTKHRRLKGIEKRRNTYPPNESVLLKLETRGNVVEKSYPTFAFDEGIELIDY